MLWWDNLSYGASNGWLPIAPWDGMKPFSKRLLPNWKQTLSFTLRFNSNSVKLQVVESWGRPPKLLLHCFWGSWPQGTWSRNDAGFGGRAGVLGLVLTARSTAGGGGSCLGPDSWCDSHHTSHLCSSLQLKYLPDSSWKKDELLKIKNKIYFFCFPYRMSPRLYT